MSTNTSTTTNKRRFAGLLLLGCALASHAGIARHSPALLDSAAAAVAPLAAHYGTVASRASAMSAAVAVR